MKSSIGSFSLLFFFFFFFFLLLASSTAYPERKKKTYKPCKSLVLYFHDIIYNGHNKKNATSVIVAAPDGFNKTVLSTPFRYGDIVIFDDPITLDNNFHSEPVGRAQGMYLYDTRYTYTAWLGFTFALNSTYHVGNINFVGADPVLKPYREISVVGGTGGFFMHRGIAKLVTDAYEDDRYFRLRVDVNFYDCW